MYRDCLLYETNFNKIYAKNNAKLKNTAKFGSYSYSFVHIMTPDKYVAFKIVSCSRTGNFL